MTFNFKIFSSLLLILLIFIFLNSTAVLAEEIVLNEKMFSIMPEEIDQNTLIVLDELSQEIEISLHNLDEDRYLLIYGGRFYMINVGSKIVKAENGEIEMPVRSVIINNKLLVPLYLIELLPEIKIDGLVN